MLSGPRGKGGGGDRGRNCIRVENLIIGRAYTAVWMAIVFTCNKVYAKLPSFIRPPQSISEADTVHPN